MQRTKNKKADLILTSDWHLREDQPDCRTDDFWKTQWFKVSIINQIQEEHNCPILHAGDLYNHWKPSPYLLAKTIENLPNQFYTILGNHDLPQHNLDLIEKTGVHVLRNAKALGILSGVHWGQAVTEHDRPVKLAGKKILVWHVTAYENNPHWHDGPTALELLKQNPEYDLIVTGHIHQSAVVKHEGRILVNPGSITRQSLDQKRQTPKVYLYYAESNTVKEIQLPFDYAAVGEPTAKSEKKARDNRINAFVEKLNTEWGSVVNFEDNLERAIQKNSIRKSVIELIYKAIEK